MGDWSELSCNIIVMVAKRLNLIEDFVSLRGTCFSWRSATHNSDFDTSWPKLPLLMVPVKYSANRRDLYSLSRRNIWNRILLPQVTKQTKCMESRGWLITVGISGRMRLLHPLTRVEIQLPRAPFRILDNGILSPYQEYRFPVKRAVLSESPSKTSNYIIVIAASISTDFLGFWKPGDRTWRKIRSSNNDFSVMDVNYYNGNIYAITKEHGIFVCDVFGPNPSEARLMFRFERWLNIISELVECGGDLLVAVPSWEEGGPVTNFEIYQLDLINAKWTKMWSIGNRAIFLGDNTSFCVDLDVVPGHVIRSDCIYFCHTPFMSRQGNIVNMGICMDSLRNKTIWPFRNSHLFSNIYLAVWLSDL